MADSVVRNATKEDDTFIFDGTSSAGDEYLMENQDPDLGTDFTKEDPNDILDRLLQNPNQSFIESMPGTGEMNFGPYDSQREVRERFVTYEGLANPALSEYNITQMNYRKPGIALNQYGDPNPDSDAIPLEYGGSPGIEGLMMKKTEIMEMPADRSRLVLNRILQQGGKPQSNDPRLMAQLNTILGRKSG